MMTPDTTLALILLLWAGSALYFYLKLRQL